MKKYLGFFLLVVLLLTAAISASEIPVQKFVLDNGLTVLVREVKVAPVASLILGVRAGTRYETWDTAGMSHQLEHMLFKGTKRFPPGAISSLFDQSGAEFNAYTSYDVTAYWETLPKEFLPIAMKVEADRMVNSLLDPQELSKEKGVVLSELRGDDNDPGNVLWEELEAVTFKSHPYHFPVIGFEETVKSFEQKQLMDYYKTYYVPNNAVLAIVGDVDFATVKKQVTEIFGALPKGKTPPAMTAVEEQPKGERRVKIYGPEGNPLLMVNLLTPGIKDADIYPLSLLDAALTNGRSSRLYKKLVDGGLVTDVGSYLTSDQDPSIWQFSMTLRPEVSQEKVEAALWSELNRLKTEPLSQDELNKAKNQVKAEFYRAKESITEQAHFLCSLELVDTYQYYFNYLANIDKQTPADLQKAAGKYLEQRKQSVGFYQPEKQESAPAAPAAAPRQANYRETSRPVTQPDLKLFPVKGFKLDFSRHILSNGTIVLIQENHATPSVSVMGYLCGGASGDQIPGTGNFVSGMLLRGAGGEDMQAIAQRLDSLGSSLSFGAGREQFNLSGWCLSANLEPELKQIESCLSQPDFPAGQLEKERQEILSGLREKQENPQSLAYDRMMELIYPVGHPFHHPAEGYTDSVEKIKLSDLQAYRQKFLRPDNLVLAIVGDVETDQLLKQLEETFRDWRAPATPFDFSMPTEQIKNEDLKEVIPMPDKSRIEIFLGKTGLPRTDDGYYSENLMNYILGGGTLTSRLGKLIRDQKGLAYHVYSYQVPSRGAAPWYLYMGIHPGDQDFATKLGKDEIKRIMDQPVTAEELAGAKLALINSLPVRLTENSGVATMLLSIHYYDLGDDYLEKFSELYQNLTAEDVQKAAKQFISTDLVEVMAGPVKEK